MKANLRCDFCRVFQLGDPRGLHHHAPSACCQGETVHREHGGAGTGGQRAGQGNTSECNYHTNIFSTAQKKKKKYCRSPSCPRIIWDIQPFNNFPLYLITPPVFTFPHKLTVVRIWSYCPFSVMNCPGRSSVGVFDSSDWIILHFSRIDLRDEFNLR